MKKWIKISGLVLAVVLLASLFWLATTNDEWVWPRRNYVYYQGLVRWWNIVGEPQTGEAGSLTGSVYNLRGQPVDHAWVILSRWDGTTFQAQTDETGSYLIEDIPAGNYVPIAGAPNYKTTILNRYASSCHV